MRNVFLAFAAVIWLACEPNIEPISAEELRTSVNPTDCGFNEEELQCIADNFYVSINHCNGQVSLAYTIFYDNSTKTWAVSLNDTIPTTNPCVVTYYNNP